MKIVGSRRIVGLISCLISVVGLALLKAPGEAYTALGLLGATYFGAAGVEQWSSAKKPSVTVEQKGE